MAFSMAAARRPFSLARALRRAAAVSGAEPNSTSRAGLMCSFSKSPSRRWLSTSKVERVSISSPQYSHRAGLLASGGQMSTMPPRTLNWPGPSTWPRRW